MRNRKKTVTRRNLRLNGRAGKAVAWPSAHAGPRKRGALQKLTVRAPARSGPSHARHHARLHAGASVFSCTIGRNGVTAFKREGDGGTPRGAFALLSGYRRQDRVARTPSALRLKATHPDDLWCDDVHHGMYNRHVRAPFSGRHEKLWRQDCLYDVCLVLDYNTTPRLRGRGSAIFFHLMDENAGPTEGCIAVRLNDMRKVLRRLASGAIVEIA